MENELKSFTKNYIVWVDIITDSKANYTVSFSPDITFFKSNTEEVEISELSKPI